VDVTRYPQLDRYLELVRSEEILHRRDQRFVLILADNSVVYATRSRDVARHIAQEVRLTGALPACFRIGLEYVSLRCWRVIA
jgi:hypothetical protein